MVVFAPRKFLTDVIPVNSSARNNDSDIITWEVEAVYGLSECMLPVVLSKLKHAA